MKDLSSGDETKQLIGFALPMLFGNIFQQFYNMVDSFVVGRFVGTSALAAVGTSFPIIFFMLALILGVSMGSTVLISQYFGAKDWKKLDDVVSTSYIFLFAAGLLMTILGLAAAPLILKLLAVPDAIMPEATAYLRITFAGMLAIFGYNGVAAMLRGMGDSKTPLYILIFSTLANIALDLLFVIVFGWGVAGVAWATIIAQGLSFIGALLMLNKRNPHLRLEIKKLHWDKQSFSQMLRIGLPTGLQQTLVSLGMMTLSRIVNEFGSQTMAAFTAASRIDSIAAMPAMNLGAAITTFTGQNIGAGKPERVRRGHLSAIAVNTALSLFISLMILFFGKRLMGIFSNDPEVIRIGASYLVIVGMFYAVFGIMFINNGVMRGAGDVFIPMINTVLALWLVRIPLALLFTRNFGMGSDGVWWSIPAGWLVGMIFSTWYYRTGRWKNPRLLRRTAPERRS
ncbi:MAG: MATE family efflux transporter [Spirochaetia bacterium]|jgi:putative MATE family efflux protein|nr:MATE family efflux transporter [Spirochaetales bacterium]MDX9784192.1 MATE family efflux transporter [Spirochaetia bacterium]